jgi:hypothetical protein
MCHSSWLLLVGLRLPHRYGNCGKPREQSADCTPCEAVARPHKECAGDNRNSDYGQGPKKSHCFTHSVFYWGHQGSFPSQPRIFQCSFFGFRRRTCTRTLAETVFGTALPRSCTSNYRLLWVRVADFFYSSA